MHLLHCEDLREGLRKVGEGDLNIKLEERSDDIGIINFILIIPSRSLKEL